MRRARGLGRAACSLAVAAVLALLARDVLGWRDAVRERRPRVRAEPAAATWHAARRRCPGTRPAGSSGSTTALRLRAAQQSFAAVQAAGRGYDNGLSESRARGELEAELAALGRSRDHVHRVDRRQPARDPRLRRRDRQRPGRSGAGRPGGGRLPGGGPARPDEHRREVQPRAAAAQAARAGRRGRARTTAPAEGTGTAAPAAAFPGEAIDRRVAHLPHAAGARCSR